MNGFLILSCPTSCRGHRSSLHFAWNGFVALLDPRNALLPWQVSGHKGHKGHKSFLRMGWSENHNTTSWGFTTISSVFNDPRCGHDVLLGDHCRGQFWYLFFSRWFLNSEYPPDIDSGPPSLPPDRSCSQKNPLVTPTSVFHQGLKCIFSPG